MSQVSISKFAKMAPKLTLKQAILILLGVVMIGCGIHFFLLPSKLSLGGATGLALLINRYIPLKVGQLLLIINVFLFILGFIMIGNKFGVLTVMASLGLSGFVWLLEVVAPIDKPVSENMFVNLVIASLLYGVGVGVVLNQSASTGGTDIVSKIINKYTGINQGQGNIMFDTLVTLLLGVTYGTEVFLHSIIGVILTGLMIDFTIDGMSVSKLCYITTSEPDRVSEFLISLGRSATIYEAKGAYSQDDKAVLQTVVNNRDFIRLKNIIKEIDPNVFMVVSNAHQVFGFHWKSLDD